jgi:tetratricopeptide (TPR) repeat protein
VSRLIFFGLAVERELSPVIDAAPFEVLARQIPRLVVKRLNGGRDRGIRYFPFVGPVDGRRQFLVLPEMLPVQKLRELCGDDNDGAIVVRGQIQAGTLRLCVHDASDTARFDDVLALDPHDLVPTIRRILFEICGVLEWQGAPPQLPDLDALALGHYLVAWDDLLGLEANLVREDASSWLRAIRQCVELAPGQKDASELLLEIVARLIGDGIAHAEVAEVLRDAAMASHDEAFLATAAAWLESINQTEAAVAVFDRLLARNPDREDVTMRLVAHHFQSGDLASAKSLLESAVARGNRSPRILAQLSVVQQKTGDREAQVATLDELAGRDDLPASVVRVVAAELTERDRCLEAVTVIEKALVAAPGDAALWLEKARALLRVGDGAAARPALEKALAHDPSPTVRQEVQRLLRLAHAPGTLRDLRAVDDALNQDDLPGALRLARRLVRQHRQMGEAWLFLGVVRQRLSQRKRAIRALRRAIHCAPKLGEAHNRLGILLVQEGKHHDAAEHLRCAVELLPWEAGPRIHLAQACYYVGQLDEGREVLAEAARLGADAELLKTVRRTFFPE